MERPFKNLDIGLLDLAFGLLRVVSVAAILIGQFVSLVVFDTIGLDQYVPGPVIFLVVPAVVMTAVPSIVAVRRYERQRALAITVGVFIATIAASLLTVSFFITG